MDSSETFGSATDQTGWFESGQTILASERGVQILESQVVGDTFKELSLLKIAALVSAAAGTSNRYELFGALVSHVIYNYGFGGKGVDGIFSFLGGSLLQKKNYKFAALPILSDGIDNVNTLRREKSLSTSVWGKNFSFVCGFVASHLKYV